MSNKNTNLLGFGYVIRGLRQGFSVLDLGTQKIFVRLVYMGGDLYRIQCFRPGFVLPVTVSGRSHLCWWDKGFDEVQEWIKGEVSRHIGRISSEKITTFEVSLP